MLYRGVITFPHFSFQASEAARAKVDVVNFSYGEACHWVDKGYEYNIIVNHAQVVV